MKINDKNLISFAISKTPIDREGWLNKRGEVNKNFQKRWFVLKGNLLFYFEKKDDREPIGVIILEGCTIELAENEETFAFKLVFHGAGNRTYILCANSQENMEEWMKAIASASYDYMKLMVAELQRQLDEITELEKQEKSTIPSRLRAGGLPVNRSDSCLCSHAGLSKVPRFNPFDRWKLQSDGTENDPSGAASVDSESSNTEGNLADCEKIQHDAQLGVKANRQKYLFLEMHEYYGQIFRRLFEEQRQKKAAQQIKSDNLLISFD